MLLERPAGYVGMRNYYGIAATYGTKTDMIEAKAAVG